MPRMLATRPSARWAVLGLAVVATLVAPGSAHAGSPQVVFERNLSLSGDWHGGEPQVAVSGNDVAVVWPEVQASGIYRNPVTGTFDTAVGTVVGYANDSSFSRCGLALSHDGGRSFRRTILPAQTAQSSLCSDAVAAFGPHHRLFAATITFAQPTSPLPLPPGTVPTLWSLQPGQGSADVVLSSKDAGETWSYPPVDAIGNRGSAGTRYAPGSNPQRGGEGTSDRPYLTVDASSGAVYVVATADLIQFNGSLESESWVTASRDGGHSFGLVYPVDTSDWKQTGGAATICAVHGRLVVAYQGDGPEGQHGVVLATSRNGGRTFTRHLLEISVPTSASVQPVTVAADPAHPGTVAVLVSGPGAQQVTVYRTKDWGVRWGKGEPLSVGGSRPWLAYGPNGDLGVMARNVGSDGSQDVYAAFSFHGRAFGKPLRVNRQTAPATPPGTLSLYDDISHIMLTGHDAWVTWGDWRKSAQNPNGEVQAWLARIALP